MQKASGFISHPPALVPYLARYIMGIPQDWGGAHKSFTWQDRGVGVQGPGDDQGTRWAFVLFKGSWCVLSKKNLLTLLFCAKKSFVFDIFSPFWMSNFKTKRPLCWTIFHFRDVCIDFPTQGGKKCCNSPRARSAMSASQQAWREWGHFEQCFTLWSKLLSPFQAVITLNVQKMGIFFLHVQSWVLGGMLFGGIIIIIYYHPTFLFSYADSAQCFRVMKTWWLLLPRAPSHISTSPFGRWDTH